MRKELAAHLGQQQALLSGYLEFLQRSAPQLLALCLSRPPAPGEVSLEGLMISAAEVDRAALLLAPLPAERGEDGGSPMDATPTPFTGRPAGISCDPVLDLKSAEIGILVDSSSTRRQRCPLHLHAFESPQLIIVLPLQRTPGGSVW